MQRIRQGVLLFLIAGALSVSASVVWTAPAVWRQGPDSAEVSGAPLQIPAVKEGEPFQVTLSEPLAAGVVYRLSFSARALSDESAVLQLGIGPLIKNKKASILSCGPVLSTEWELFSVPFTVLKDSGAGELPVFAQYGWGTADAELRDVRIEDFGSVKPLNAYVRTGRWYAGQNRDAAWRAEAETRIEKYRKGDLTIRVIDSRGQPREGVRVIAEQQSHAYRFGTAVNSLLYRWIATDAHLDRTLQAAFEEYRRTSGRSELTFAERQAEIQRYFKVLESNFNFAVLENALKWEAWSGAWGGFQREDTMELIDWLTARKIGVKAHTLVWPGWNHVPAFLKSLKNDPGALRRVIDAHITDMGLSLNGKVKTVDVLNEAFNNSDLMKVLGDEEMAAWFKRAKAAFPDTQLNVNEFLLMANGGQWAEKLDFYEGLAGRLLDAGAPLEGLGFQSHFRHTHLTSPERIWELCDRFSRFGVPLISSEFDVNLPDEKLQAEYTRDFMTAWFAHPATTTFMLWGFWQDSHWLPYGGLYDRDWREKPNARAYRDLVFEQWWSGWEEALTSADGQVSLRGFLGTYRVSIYADGIEKTIEDVAVTQEGTTLTIHI